jgi:hypothetical protein
MTIFAELRALVLLRRVAIAQERTAALLEEYMAHLRAEWLRTQSRKPRATEFASFDAEAANREWLAAQEAGEVGATLEDRSR